MKKIIKTFLVIYLFFGFIGYVHAETYALNEDESQNGEKVVPENGLIIGTHLITDPTKASTRLIMDATQTVVGDDAIIYQKLLDKEDADDEDEYPEGWWIDAISGEDEVPANVNGLICITHVNGEQVQDPDCDATRFAVKFTGITGEQDSKTVSIVNGEKIAAADIPTPKTKKGYEFVCWVKSDAVNEDRSSCYDFSQTISESVDLAPHYDLIKYKIHFDLNGIDHPTTQLNDQTCTIEDLADPDSNCKLPDLQETRKGYKFDGWSTVKDETGDKGTHFEANKSMADMLGDEYDITLYAVWKPQLYDITYNLDGGTYQDQTVLKSSYTVTTKDNIELFVPSRKGYIFTGWKITSPQDDGVVNPPGDGHEGKYTLSVGEQLEALTLTAQWKEKEFTITYDLNLDEYPELSKVSANNKAYATMLADLVNPQNTECKFETGCTLAKAPTRDDYIFAGWADENEYLYTGGNNYTGVDFGDDQSQVKLTAQWNAKNEPLYKIEFNLDGGSFTGKVGEQFGRKTIDTQLPSPEKVGYKFKGWCSDSGKTENCKENAKIQDFLNNNGASPEDLNDLTLYAKWEANTYTIEFYEPISLDAIQLAQLSAGSPDEGYQKLDESGTKTCTYDTNCPLDTHSEHFDEKNEILRGWKLNYGAEANNNNVYLSDNITVKNLTSKDKGVVKLYAVAETVEYTITYYLDGGKFAEESEGEPKTKVTKGEKVTIKNPTKEGYTFKGWEDDKGEDVPDADIADSHAEDSVTITVEKNMVLVAKWKEDHKIEVYLDGGKLDDTNNDLTTKKYKDGATVDIKNPTKEGYKFVKWVDKEGKDISSDIISEQKDQNSVKVTVNKDLFLVAVWDQSNPEMKIENNNISDVKKDEWKTIELKISPNNHNGTKVKIVTTITKDNQTLSEQGKVEARLNEVNTILPFLSSETSQNDTSGKLTLPTSKGFRLKPGSACELANIDGACEEKDEDGQVKKKYDFKFSDEGTYKVKFEVYDYNYPEDGPLSSTEITVTVSGSQS